MVKKIILWLLVIGCMALIFCFSAQPAKESSLLSDGLLNDILNFFNIHLSEDAIIFLRMLIRKVAHFSVYALLGYLVYMLLYVGYELKNKTCILQTVVICALYAVSDEVHQIFVAGRTGKITDVLIDTAGCCAGILVAISLCRIILRRKKHG